VIAELQGVMASEVGPFRTAAGLELALAAIARLGTSLGSRPPTARGHFDTARLDWFDARNMLLVAEAVAQAALDRTESRGAHQRDDFPVLDENWALNQTVRLAAGRVALARLPVGAAEAAQ
jgi:succinate dehydrogenase / fumarate reductase flavoprotein subunit/fumarate reductase (CoM/CoB) subunit A